VLTTPLLVELPLVPLLLLPLLLLPLLVELELPLVELELLLVDVLVAAAACVGLNGSRGSKVWSFDDVD